MIVKGQRINGRYEIIRSIGEGGMANVYLAYDTILNRDVAVKILRGDLANDEKFVKRFQREAVAASSLTHPNIVEMYDVGVDDGNYFIVMEYIDGITLKSLIKKRGALTISETVDIMLQITSAIACAHDSYIIHRDIKPQNVMILDDGVAKITDFGIAMAMKSAELTQTNTVMGSVHYLPPEQANGKGSTVKSDIYSLGIMMYEMLIGKVPFKGDNAVEIAMKQINDPIPSVCHINPEIPQSIENIILKATAKNPKNRYDSVNEMHEDLVHALEDDNKESSRLTYEYPEQELENTKVLPNLNEIKVKPKVSKAEKGLNISLVIVSVIFVLLAVGLLITVLVLPKVTEVPDVKIPNVSGLTVAEAENTLNELGFIISSTTEERKDTEIAAGKVIGIKNYNVGDVVKQGKTVTLVVSSGSDEVVVEDYVGQKYQEVEVALTKAGLQVIIEKQATTDKDKYKEDVIIKQNIEVGTKLTKGDIIRLYIETLEVLYPNFKTYTVSDVESFCEENEIDLVIEYKETTQYNPGTILNQSRAEGNVVRANTTLTITVAKVPEAALDVESSSEE
ncbi:MAG: Stk1 family PASTA domain-containing Ser/Thr kinase [Bacilli bacterium]|nr:Stk1 family PASTA domain-containing Ser/Thr kinase [Bacilli bacterium]